MILYYIFYAIWLLSACGIALILGRFTERLTALVLLVASLVSPMVVESSFVDPEVGLLVVDTGVFAFLFAVALMSDRFWPMWAAAFQSVDTFIHVARFMDLTMLPTVYSTAEAFWAYPVLAALGVGTWVEVKGFREIR